MGILDDAIKEHLELKRQHGAAEDELKQLEDEAFGAAERPGGEESAVDPLAEAPTQFMTQPELEEEAEEASPRSRRPDVADLQEPPPPPVEHEAVPEPSAPAAEIPSGPTTEEREAIAEQPTEMFDVEEELAAAKVEDPPVEDEPEEEPENAASEDEYEEDDDFWDEKRLSDELDQALEAPLEVEDEEALFEDAASEDEEPEPEPEQPERRSSSGQEEDVLEETPDFLEEAPEDDQLWFEQKPPKDFDFDD